MRDLYECKLEIFQRSKKRITARRRARNRILALCVPVCLIIAAFAATTLPEVSSNGADVGSLEIAPDGAVNNPSTIYPEMSGEKYSGGSGEYFSARTTVYFNNGKSYSFIADKSADMVEILMNLKYEKAKLCNCLPEYKIDIGFETHYGINLTEGYARCDKGQADLTKKQIEVLENNKEKTNSEIIELLVENAIKLEDEDIQINKKIGEYGSEIIPKGATILTHCNAGALATVGWGTALGVVRSAFEKDKTIKVFADETRPRGQGARLTTYELTRDGIDTTLITDGMGAYFMNKKMIDVVVVGADRIALNGDSANKIGTYMVAIAAKYHNIPFYIAAPKSTIDPTIKTGDEIVIELRNKEEVTIVNDKPICTDKVNVINPSFDVTPNELITGIITEYGIFKPNEIYKLFG